MIGGTPLAQVPGLTRVIWNGRELFHAHRLVVKLAPDAAAAKLDELERSYPELARLRGPNGLGHVVYRVPEGTDVVSLAQRLGREPGLAWAEPDAVHTLASTPNDPDYGKQWGPMKLNLEHFWNRPVPTNTGAVMVAVVDSGISLDKDGNLDHPDLDAKRFILGRNYVDPGAPVRDVHGHGTHCAGTIAATTNNGNGIAGINPVSTVWVAKVADGPTVNGSDGAEAIIDAVDEAVRRKASVVINYSIGSAVETNVSYDACAHVHEHGMLLCAAAGNSFGAPVHFPAAFAARFPWNVIAVGATDESDEVAEYSNGGPELTLVAPGSNIYSTLPSTDTKPPGYGIKSGTSMATPFVTRLASLIWSGQPKLTTRDLVTLLVSHAKKLSDDGTRALASSDLWGNGRLHAHVSATGTPSALVTTGGEACHVFFVGEKDEVIYDAVYDGRWRCDQVTGPQGLVEDASTTRARGSPSALVYGSDEVNVCFRGTDDLLYRLVSRVPWSIEQLTGEGGHVEDAPKAAGNPCAVAYRAANQLHVVYRASDGQLWDIGFDPTVGWFSNQLTGGSTGAPSPAGDPAVVEFGSQLHVCYRSTANEVLDRYYAGSWITQHLAKDAAAEGDPSVAVRGGSEGMYVFYRANGVLKVASYEGSWRTDQLTQPSQPHPMGHPCGVVYDGTPRVYFRSELGRLYVCVRGSGGWGPPSPVSGSDRVPDASTDADANPANVIYKGQLHVLYVDPAGNVQDRFVAGGLLGAQRLTGGGYAVTEG